MDVCMMSPPKRWGISILLLWDLKFQHILESLVHMVGLKVIIHLWNFPPGIYLFNVNNGNTRIMCAILKVNNKKPQNVTDDVVLVSSL